MEQSGIAPVVRLRPWGAMLIVPTVHRGHARLTAPRWPRARPGPNSGIPTTRWPSLPRAPMHTVSPQYGGAGITTEDRGNDQNFARRAGRQRRRVL